MCGPYPARMGQISPPFMVTACNAVLASSDLYLCLEMNLPAGCCKRFTRFVKHPAHAVRRWGKEMLRPVATVAHKVRAWSLCGGREDSQKKFIKTKEIRAGTHCSTISGQMLRLFRGQPASRSPGRIGSPRPQTRLCRPPSVAAFAINNRAGATVPYRSGAHVARMPGAAGKNLWEHTRGADGILCFRGAHCIGRVIGLAVRMT